MAISNHSCFVIQIHMSSSLLGGFAKSCSTSASSSSFPLLSDNSEWPLVLFRTTEAMDVKTPRGGSVLVGVSSTSLPLRHLDVRTTSAARPAPYERGRWNPPTAL
ncbi:unnamed protein product [Pleuronectes platessa]|uniref:Uncharacterized protein n=1 Tax=Pleuronectes platessa TaxID=8262 RepID=A0A9N7UUM6_PLEPL|nr:unnamed protein product [Pleuronectes platessa]